MIFPPPYLAFVGSSVGYLLLLNNYNPSLNAELISIILELLLSLQFLTFVSNSQKTYSIYGTARNVSALVITKTILFNVILPALM